MTDTRKKSITEALCNILVGYPINHTANMIILVPLAHPILNTYETNGLVSLEFQGVLLLTGLLYTITSVVRQYFFRRLFNRFGANENAYTLILRILVWLKHAPRTILV